MIIIKVTNTVASRITTASRIIIIRISTVGGKTTVDAEIIWVAEVKVAATMGRGDEVNAMRC
jgi:hypothetical protein